MTIKASAILETVKVLAAEKPDTTTGCNYFTGDDNTPCCIVGHAMSRLGYQPNTVDTHEWEDFNKYTNVYSLFTYGIEGFDLDIDYVILEKLRQVQEAQDTGSTWGEAIKALGE